MSRGQNLAQPLRFMTLQAICGLIVGAALALALVLLNLDGIGRLLLHDDRGLTATTAFVLQFASFVAGGMVATGLVLFDRSSPTDHGRDNLPTRKDRIAPGLAPCGRLRIWKRR